MTSLLNLKNLPKAQSIGPGMFLLVETPTGTQIIDFQNFVIGTDNISFAPTLSSLDTEVASISASFDSFYASITTLVNQVSADFALEVSDTVATLTSQYNSLNTALTNVNNIVSTLNGQNLAANITLLSGSVDSINAQLASISSQLNSVFTTVQAHSGTDHW